MWILEKCWSQLRFHVVSESTRGLMCQSMWGTFTSERIFSVQQQHDSLVAKCAQSPNVCLWLNCPCLRHCGLILCVTKAKAWSGTRGWRTSQSGIRINYPPTGAPHCLQDASRCRTDRSPQEGSTWSEQTPASYCVLKLCSETWEIIKLCTAFFMHCKMLWPRLHFVLWEKNSRKLRFFFWNSIFYLFSMLSNVSMSGNNTSTAGSLQNIYKHFKWFNRTFDRWISLRDNVFAICTQSRSLYTSTFCYCNKSMQKISHMSTI